MKRHQAYGASAVVLISVWVYLKFFYQKSSATGEWLVDVAPFYILICFGCYCLSKLGTDLYTFNDYPDEIFKLEHDIKVADDDLKKRGFSQ
jgi:dolichol-phosphate mannosyltransferase subunit 3